MLADAAAMLIVALIALFLLDRFPQIGLRSGVSVTDGDSLRRGPHRIRLYGIDAPELGQKCLDSANRPYPCGEAARRALAELIGGRDVVCEIVEKDRYQRDVGRCRVESVELNREMVRLGWALAYGRHSIDYIVAEAAARSGKRGLWQGEFELPEDFRAQQREAVKRGQIIEPEWLEAH